MSDQLPSIDNLPESELPSVDEFIKDEQELPSVNDFIENPDESDEIEAAKLEEKKKECGEGEYFCNDEQKCKPIPKGHKVLEDGELVKEEADLTEILRLINNVRKDIPDIPEIKYYDEELKQLSEQVELVRDSIPEIPEPPEIPEIKYYDDEIASLREEINQNAADIPEIKYYDEQVNDLEEKIKVIKEDIVNLPEPKYYEADLESLKEDILAVKESIPVFPKWVNEVNQVPDFSWIGKTFGVIDDDFSKVNDHINDLKDKFDDDLLHLTEDLDKKDFEQKVVTDKVIADLKEAKDNIYKELRESALRINDTRHSFKNDDRLLKKDILGKLNVLKQRVEEEVKEFNRKNTEAKDIFDGYFTALTEEIENLPKVKYYDEDIKEVRKEFNIGLHSLKILVEEIKGKQEVLKEEVNKRPIQPDPEESNVDPLTPTNQNFATHEDLAKHYKLFVNRVQQQLYTIGGGGAGFIKDLDDVEFDQTTGTNKLLIYDGSQWVGIASTSLSGSTTLDEVLEKGNVSGIGMSVGVITATSGYFSGILTAAQLNYDVVTDIYSTGIVTATKGIQQTGNEGLHVTAGVSTFVGLTSCLGGLNVKAGSANTSLIVEGDTRIIGILTIGTGSVTIDGSTNKVKIGTGVTLTSTGEADFVGVVTAKGFEVGTAATIYENGNITCGILTATNFIGDGSGLTGVANTDNVVSTTLSVSGVVTAIGGLYVGTAASIYSNGNATYSGIVTANKFIGDGSGLSGVTAITINNNADNRIITGSDTSNTLNGESNLTYDGSKFSVGTAATIAGNGNATFSGVTTAITVNSTGAVNATTQVNVSSGATMYANGNIAAAGIVTANGGFVGGLTGNVTGNADTATTATTATNITVSANNSTDETVYPIFVDGSTGGQGAESDTGLTYNPSDGNLTATTFTGALTGNVTGNASGSSGSCTGNAAGLTGTPNITVGDVVAASLDISGNADIDGTLEADAITVNGTALDTHIAGVTVTNATNSSHVLVTDNESTDEDNLITFVEGATSSTGNVGLEMDGNLTYNPSTGRLTATQLAGTLQTAAQANVTSLGTLTTLTVDNVIVNGTTIGHTSDTDLMTLADGSITLAGQTNVGTAATLFANGNITCGIITATNLVGDGSGLTNISGIPSEADTAVSSTSATTVLSLSASTYRAAVVDVLITQGSAYQAGQYGLIHDGTTASIIEQWAVATGSMLGTFTATISGGNMLMQVNMGSSSSATVTVKSATITV